MVKIGADIGGLQRGLAVAGANIGAFASGSMKVAGLAAAGFTAGLAAVGAVSAAGAVGVYKLANAASNLAEAQNVVNATFKASGAAVNEWAGTLANSAGIGQTSATKMVGTLGAMIKTMTGSEKEAEKMSKSITQLAGDFASFYNLDSQTAFDKLRSGLAGEIEPLKQLGYNLNADTLGAYALSKGMKTAYDKMSEGEKVILRYKYLMDVSRDAQGDFIRTSQGLANSQRTLALNFENLSTTIGAMFMPAVTRAVQAVSDLAVEINALLKDGFQESDIENIGDKVAQSLGNGIQAFTRYVPGILKIVQKLLSESLKVLIEVMPTLFPVLAQSFFDLLQSVFDAIIANTKPLMTMTTQLVEQLGKFITKNLPDIVNTGVQIILAIGEGLMKALPQLLESIPAVIDGIVATLKAYDWETVGTQIGNRFSDSFEGRRSRYDMHGGYQYAAQANPALEAKYASAKKVYDDIVAKSASSKKTADALAIIKKAQDNVKKIEDAIERAKNPVKPSSISGINSAAKAIDALKTSVKGLVDAMQAKTAGFANFVGMFDVFERTAISAERVINRLKNQVKAMQEWKASLAKLEARGASAEFVNELRNMGPGSVDYVKAVANMSDAQLKQTQGYVAEKYRIAGEQASSGIAYENKIQTNIEKQINLNITGSKQDGKEIARLVMKELEIAGYRIK